MRRLLLPALLLSLAACHSGSGTEAVGFVGQAPVGQHSLPTGTWTDQDGKPYTLATGTATLVYFGYTSCPDVCPTVMADLATTLRALKPAVSSRVRVVMITSDPRRDTPATMKTWLEAFKPPQPFIGLTGPFAQIAATAAALDIPLSKTEPATVEDVAHGARLYAFDASGASRESWLPSEHLVSDLEHDLPQLV